MRCRPDAERDGTGGEHDSMITAGSTTMLRAFGNMMRLATLVAIALSGARSAAVAQPADPVTLKFPDDRLVVRQGDPIGARISVSNATSSVLFISCHTRFYIAVVVIDATGNIVTPASTPATIRSRCVPAELFAGDSTDVRVDLGERGYTLGPGSYRVYATYVHFDASPAPVASPVAGAAPAGAMLQLQVTPR